MDAGHEVVLWPAEQMTLNSLAQEQTRAAWIHVMELLEMYPILYRGTHMSIVGEAIAIGENLTSFSYQTGFCQPNRGPNASCSGSHDTLGYEESQTFKVP